MADNIDLTEEQNEKLLNFREIADIDDVAVCRNALERNGWDLELAVQQFLRERDEGPSARTAPQLEINYAEQRVIFNPPDQQDSGIRNLIGYTMSLITEMCYNTISYTTNFAYRMIVGDPVVPQIQPVHPVVDVLNFINSYETTYGELHPIFYRDTYSRALRTAREELRFLLVYLHEDDNPHSVAFCRDVLSSQDVASHINDTMLFWGCSILSPEGARVSTLLRPRGYPFLAVIVLRQNMMTVVGRIEGPVESADLISHLQTIVNENQTHLDSERAERQARNAVRDLKDEQDRAYQESLQADREKELRRIEEEKRKREEEERRVEEIRKKKEEYKKRIPDEPPADCPDAITIVLKLPNGSRLERRFLQSHSLQHLFYYVYCQPEAPNYFEITMNFPKRILQCQPDSEAGSVQTLSEAGIQKGEVLFVHDLEA